MGLNRYEAYVDSMLNELDRAYVTACMEVTEGMKMSFEENGLQTTLYYYDRAGNLRRTVPPLGVEAMDVNLQKVNAIEASLSANFDTTTLIQPEHEMSTFYEYNSLNEVVYEASPDGGATHYYYDRLGRMVASQNAKQKPKSQYSYTRYDGLGRIIEVGEVANSPLRKDSLRIDLTYYERWLQKGARTEITRSHYDQLSDIEAAAYFPGGEVQHLRNRIASISYARYDSVMPSHSTHFSYDIHGNVTSLVHDRPDLEIYGQRYKVLEYRYDLLSGLVNELIYQRGKGDALYHRYEYDQMERLKAVYSSRDGKLWEREAGYDYYRHGPLGRKELGQNRVQGLDYVYTIHGWLKGINTDGLLAHRDPGRDGLSAGAAARDGFGFALGYYEGDYQSINFDKQSFLETKGTDLAEHDLFNGNIKYQSMAIAPLMEEGKPVSYKYRYDQLNRLTNMQLYEGIDTGDYAWQSGGLRLRYKTSYEYDANGNLLKLNRNGNEIAKLAMDRLSYSYHPGTNQLRHVKDSVGAEVYSEDINNQEDDNYGYDAIGNMVKDSAEEIDSIYWNAYGKVWKIKRTVGSERPDLEFAYDGNGHRVLKLVKNGQTQEDWVYTYYVRDAQGNILATYEKRNYSTEDREAMMAAFVDWLKDEHGIDSLAGFFKENYAADLSFVSHLTDEVVSNGNSGLIIDEYTFQDFFDMDVNLLGIVLESYISTASQQE